MSQISRLRDAEISNGNIINADDLDTEFNQLINESNSQDTRLGTHDTSLTTLTEQMANSMAGPAPLYASSSTITLKAGLHVRNNTNTANIRLASDLTLSLATGGAGGLDTGAVTTGWYYVYLIKKSSDGTVSAVFSSVNEASTGSITLPTGYDLKRQLPLAVRYVSSAILPFQITGGWPYRPNIIYTEFGTGNASYQALIAGTSSGTVNLSTLVPAISTSVNLEGVYSCNSATLGASLIRKTGSTNYTKVGDALISSSLHSIYQHFYQFPTNNSQQIDYLVQTAGSLNLSVAGFTVTEVN